MAKTTNPHFSIQNGFRSVFSTIFLFQLLFFLLSNPFWTRNLPIFDPPEPSKSSIFIERVVIFEVSTFSVRMLFFFASWQALGLIFGAFPSLLGRPWGHFSGPKATTPKSPPPLFERTCFKMRPGLPKSAKKVRDLPKVRKRSPKCPQNIPQMSSRGLLKPQSKPFRAFM